MKARDKWLKPADDARVSQAAEQLVRQRMVTVYRWLPEAAGESPGPVEAVHQLRVSTRRATAALQVFKHLLPKKKRRYLKSRLRRLRKSGDAARNLDVLIELARDIPQLDEGRRLQLIDRLTAQRGEAQQPLRKCFRRLRHERFRRRASKALGRIAWREKDGQAEPLFVDFAQEAFQQAVARFFDLALHSDFNAPEALHRLRIEGKKLRYSVELLGSALPSNVRRDFYPRLKQMQQELGDVNDHLTAANIIEELAPSDDERLTATWAASMAHHRQTAETLAREFRRQWSAQRFGRLRVQAGGLSGREARMPSSATQQGDERDHT